MLEHEIFNPFAGHVDVVHPAVHEHGEFGNLAVLNIANALTVGDGLGALHAGAIRVAAVESHGQECDLQLLADQVDVVDQGSLTGSLAYRGRYWGPGNVNPLLDHSIPKNLDHIATKQKPWGPNHPKVGPS